MTELSQSYPNTAIVEHGVPLTEQKQRQGVLFALVGPAGVGKNTIMVPVMENVPQLRQLPTVTTRAPRPGEQEGQQHFFVSLERFREMAAGQDLLEHQEVHPGKYYGVPRRFVEDALQSGQTLIADIDILGAEALKQAFPVYVVSIFIAPPSLETLNERLHQRGNMSEKEIRDRLARAEFELSRAERCDYRIINDTVEQSVASVTEIIRAELHKRDCWAD